MVDGLSGQDIGKRRSAAAGEIVGGAHEEVLVPLERASLGQSGLQHRILRAAEVHTVAGAKNRPAAFSRSPGKAQARAPLVAGRGNLLGQRQSRIVDQGDGRWEIFAFPAQRGRHHEAFRRLPLGSGEGSQIVGAEAPVGGPHGLRIVGIAGKVAQAAQLVAAVAPGAAALIAIVLIKAIERAGDSVLREDQRIGSEVFDGRIVIGTGVVAHHAGRVGVVAPIRSGFDEEVAVNPVQRLLNLVEVFVRIAAASEPRGIADGEAVARVHHHLGQLTPRVDVERLLEGRGRVGLSGEDVAANRALRYGEQVGRKERFPAAQHPELAGPAGSKAVAPVRARRCG